MRFLKTTMWVASIIFVFSSCTKTERIIREIHSVETTDRAKNEVDDTPISPENIKLAEKVRANCPSSGKCHPSVVQLGIASARGYWVCTGFLIAPDLLMTNAHCAPLIKTRFKAYAFFPMTAEFPEKRIEVSSIPYQTANGEAELDNLPKETAQDFAIFHLSEKSDRPVITLSNETIQDSGEYFASVIDPSDDVTGPGTARYEGCIASIGTVWDGDYQRSGRTYVSSMKECSTRGGNSGSPLLNRKGAAVGIISSHLSTIGRLKSRLGNIPTAEQTTVSTRTDFISRVGCMPLNAKILMEKGLLSSANCEEGYRLKDLLPLKAPDLEAALTKAPKALNPLADKNVEVYTIPPLYEASLAEDQKMNLNVEKHQSFVISAPACYKPSNTGPHSALLFTVTSDTDALLRPTVRIDDIRTVEYTLKPDVMRIDNRVIVDVKLNSGIVVHNISQKACE